MAENDNVDVEIGLFFTDNGTGWGGDSVVGTTENPKVSFSFDSTAAAIDIFVHTHYKGLLSIFSPGDLQAYHQILSNNFSANGTNLVFMLITNAGTKYAFKVTDLTKFNTVAQEHFTTTDNLNQFGEDYFDDINTDNDNDTNELELLKMMKKIDLGISFFKANDDFSEWKELTLNDTEDDTIEKPCD